MEQTLGKRIAACRKGLGLTQEQLAERLGVTAQAVSKWENDQSCPDITMLPRLSELFSVTTDELLGVKRETVHEAQVVAASPEEEDKEEGPRMTGDFEIQFDGGKRGKIGLGLWVVLTGAVLLYGQYRFHHGFTLWDALWPSGLLVLGLLSFYPHFSVFRLACGLYGGYTLVNLFLPMPAIADGTVAIALILLVLGLVLLTEAFRKPGKRHIHIHRDGQNPGVSNHFTMGEESFDCGLSFGENRHLIDLPRLREGRADLSFGEMTVDLTGCEEIAEGCRLFLDAAFGEMTLLVPGKYRVEHHVKTAFAAVSVDGEPDREGRSVIYLDGKVSFGHLEIRYI